MLNLCMLSIKAHIISMLFHSHNKQLRINIVKRHLNFFMEHMLSIKLHSCRSDNQKDTEDIEYLCHHHNTQVYNYIN
jgi:hypothetical protein